MGGGKDEDFADFAYYILFLEHISYNIWETTVQFRIELIKGETIPFFNVWTNEL